MITTTDSRTPLVRQFIEARSGQLRNWLDQLEAEIEAFHQNDSIDIAVLEELCKLTENLGDNFMKELKALELRKKGLESSTEGEK